MTASFSEDTAHELCDGEMKTEPSDLQLLERMRRGELAGGDPSLRRRMQIIFQDPIGR